MEVKDPRLIGIIKYTKLAHKGIRKARIMMVIATFIAVTAQAYIASILLLSVLVWFNASVAIVALTLLNIICLPLLYCNHKRGALSLISKAKRLSNIVASMNADMRDLVERDCYPPDSFFTKYESEIKGVRLVG